MITHTKKISLDLIAFCYLHTQHDYLQMRKPSTSDNNGDETVLSEIYRGGYVNADDEVELPNYLVHLPSHNDVITEMDVEE